MRYGMINCDCGQAFHFETVRLEIDCIKCGMTYDVKMYPEKTEEPVEAIPEETSEELLSESGE